MKLGFSLEDMQIATEILGRQLEVKPRYRVFRISDSNIFGDFTPLLTINKDGKPFGYSFGNANGMFFCAPI